MIFRLKNMGRHLISYLAVRNLCLTLYFLNFESSNKAFLPSSGRKLPNRAKIFTVATNCKFLIKEDWKNKGRFSIW